MISNFERDGPPYRHTAVVVTTIPSDISIISFIYNDIMLS